MSRRRPVSRRGRRWPRQRALAASATTCHICRCYYCASCRRRTSSTGSLCLWPIAVCALAVYVHNPPVGNLLLSHAFMPGLTHDDEDNKVSPMTTMTLMTWCYLFDTEWEYLACSYISTKSTYLASVIPSSDFGALICAHFYLYGFRNSLPYVYKIKRQRIGRVNEKGRLVWILQNMQTRDHVPL